MVYSSKMSVKSNVYDLIVSGQAVPIRIDGFINVTILCKLANKHFKNWYKSTTAKEIVTSFQEAYNETHDIHRPILELGKGSAYS